MTLAPPQARPPARKAKLKDFTAAPAPATHAGPTDGFWTLETFRRAADAGVFDEFAKVELVGGRVYTMAAFPAEPHVFTTMMTASVLRGVFGDDYTVREEKGFERAPDTEAGPDVAVVAGSLRDILTAGRPRRAELIVEIAVTSQTFDLNIKRLHYAASGTPEYWVIDVPARRATVFRDPQPDNASESGFDFKARFEVREDSDLTPLAKRETSVKLADLLP